MRIKLVCYLIGKLAIGMGAAMSLPLMASMHYQDGDFPAFAISMLVALILGIALLIVFRDQKGLNMRQREGFLFATASWVVAALIGAMPYIISGTLPNVINAFFESMSGFTTTGASVLTDIESVSHGVLMWRSMTQWLGGAGIVVLFVAILYGGNNASGNQMYKAEAPGNSISERITAKIGDTSKILWATYIILTIILVILLKVGGMTAFDSICHAFSTMSTGGFSTKNASMGFYFDNPFLIWVTIIFMFLAGSNIAFFYTMIKKRQNVFWKNEEFRVYFYVVLAVTALITLNLVYNNYYDGESIFYIIRQAAFQTVTVMTTTGYATADFNLWPALSKMLLITLFFVGACSGSTSGSMKVGRMITLVKSSFAELARMAHPSAVRAVRLNGQVLSNSVLQNVIHFFILYMGLFFIGCFIMSFLGLDFVEAVSSVATAMGNVGPGFGLLGPSSNFASVPFIGQIVLAFYMLLGRLELYSLLVLILPAVWRK